MDWSQAPQRRNELVLFPTMLDDCIPADHSVRLLDAILRKLDWSAWEQQYQLVRGMPPIHPRVLAGVILFGFLKRVRTTRGLEEALKMRVDFRWLAEGREIDHTTICRFRQKFGEALKDLFIQVGLVAREMGAMSLHQLGYDGTKVRASNRRRGTRSPEELRQAKQALKEQFDAHQKACEQAQCKEDESFDEANKCFRSAEEQSLKRQMEQVDRALAELEAIEAAGKQVPNRLPTTDPSSRISPNKEGGFAPNYTPTVTVDIETGMIADCDVIMGSDEQSYMHDAVDRVRENFQLDSQTPLDVLADGLMATAENIKQSIDNNINLFTPSGPENPAYRENPREPVAAEKIDSLPLRGKAPTGGEEDTRTFDKSAFMYDPDNDVYWCPMGKPLERYCETHDHRGDTRFAYRAEKQTCTECPLKAKCFKNTRGQYGRRIECGEHEKIKQAHTAKMQDASSKVTYQKRASATERPFAMIKHVFGVRSFLTRGLERVRNEWRWAATAYNLDRLIRLLAARSGAP